VGTKVATRWGVLWVMIAVVGLGAVTVGLAIWGARLPETHTVTISRAVPLPIGQVWSVLIDFAGQASWRPDFVSAERQDDFQGRAVWREVYKGSQETLIQTIAREKPIRLVRRLEDVRGTSKALWSYELTDHGGVTQLTVTETGNIRNPIARWGLRYMVGQAAYLESYMDALCRHLDKVAGKAPQSAVGKTKKRQKKRR